MNENLPFYINAVFILTVLSTLWLFYKASNSKKAVLIATIWLIIQMSISLTGFYTFTKSIPPRFIFLIGPPLITIIIIFLTEKGRNFIDKFDQKWMTYLHTVRIPVEIVLLLLFTYKLVPQLMTFEGRNFDILSGISAPIVAYLGYSNKKLNKNVLLIWNCICLALLFNIVINAFFSLPLPFQKFAFDQPNIGLLYFPFVWLPCFIVPAVLLSHLTSIRQLLKKNK